MLPLHGALWHEETGRQALRKIRWARVEALCIWTGFFFFLSWFPAIKQHFQRPPSSLPSRNFDGLVRILLIKLKQIHKRANSEITKGSLQWASPPRSRTTQLHADLPAEELTSAFYFKYPTMGVVRISSLKLVHVYKVFFFLGECEEHKDSRCSSTYYLASWRLHKKHDPLSLFNHFFWHAPR